MTNIAIEYAKSHPQFSFGIHFYLVDEKPLSNPKDIPSMVDPRTGKLWTTRQFILRNFAGLVKVKDLKHEMKLQFLAVKNAGVNISHVDGHGHNHRLPQSIKALDELKDELGFTKVRRCQDLAVADGKLGLLSRVINKSMQHRLDKAGFKMTDHFLMNAGHTSNPYWFSKTLCSLPNGITEIGVHPGMDEEWRWIDTEDFIKNCEQLTSRLNIERISYHNI